MEYQPLDIDRNEIRLLTVLSPAIKDHQVEQLDLVVPQVNCLLETFSLDDYIPEYREYAGDDAQSVKAHSAWLHARLHQAGFQPTGLIDIPTSLVLRFVWGDFAALSYMWGDQGSSRQILVNGYSVDVTENLEAALRQLSCRISFTGGIKLWVDALCINQNDILERNVQVKRMRNIYSQAMSVWVWLGIDADESHKAIRLLSDCADNNRPAKAAEYLETLRLNPNLFEPGSWKALYQFLNRGYWKRLWIIQEIAMGRIQLNLLCGNTSLLWSKLWAGIGIISMEPGVAEMRVCQECEEAGFPYRRRHIFVLMTRIQQMEFLRKDEEGRRDGRPLMQLMRVSRQSQQTDARDKVYAIMGLLDPSITARIQPDYSL